MKKLNILFVTLLLSFTLSEILVCEAQYADIIKGIGVVIKIATAARKYMKHQQNKTADDHVVQNQKLDRITTKIESLERKMARHFKELFAAVTDVASDAIHGQIAVTFENSMQSIDNKLEELIIKKEDVDKGILRANDTHFESEIHDYKYQLVKFKDQLEVIMMGKDYSHDFLESVKDRANVCTDQMSQVQLLDSFRALYVDTISRYLMARHIIISLWERADETRYDDKKLELNKEVRRYLLFHVKRFQKLMAQASREYQSCTTPALSSQHFLHTSVKRSPKCYMKGEGDLSNQIVKFDGHRGSGNKYCYDFLSLRPAIARPGYVVVGASIARNVNILYVKIVEGKLLPNGIIDPTSITHNEDPAPGIGEKVVHLDYRWSLFDITETIAPDNRVITRLKFSQTDDQHNYLEVLTQEIELDSGSLIENTRRSEPHKKGLTRYTLRGFEQRNDTIIRNSAGLEPVKPNQFVKFIAGGRLNAHPAIELGDVYPTPLTLLSGASLYVRQVLDTQGLLSIRLHTFNIAPHVTKIDFELNDDFADVLKSIQS